MLQELLQNIVKHAEAKQALLELVEHEHDVSILMEDDGIGINLDDAANGKGLETVRSKIAYLKGRFEIGRKKEGGTLIVIELPIVHQV